jgi:hypothetical protein
MLRSMPDQWHRLLFIFAFKNWFWMASGWTSEIQAPYLRFQVSADRNEFKTAVSIHTLQLNEFDTRQ